METDITLKYSEKIINHAKESIMIKYRFFNVPLSKIKVIPQERLNGYKVSGDNLYYNPQILIRDYLNDANIAIRLYIHVLFHKLFLHEFKSGIDNFEYWSLAADIAVENVVLELTNNSIGLLKDDEERIEIDFLKKRIPFITAEYVYRYFQEQRIGDEKIGFYKDIFGMDIHEEAKVVKKEEEIQISFEDWKKLSRRVMTEIKRFSDGDIEGESLSINLRDAIKKRESYEDILRKFSVWGEEIKVNPDEFDYVYYTYGLKMYNNMPLIEPLEYTEDKRIRDFVIVIDTSASCSNAQIKDFLTKTVTILSSTENFFKKINIHVIAADAEVQWDKKITNLEEMANLATNFTLAGRGATDFRPAFDRVDLLRKQKELEDLKGLIYFTDGYGVYPSKAPDYGVIFAFTDEDKNRPKVPTWAIAAVLTD